jgi:hypothetical protein
MAGNLTQWEKDQIKTIDNLIQKCKLRYYAFEREHLRLNTAAPQDVETLKKGLKESVPKRLRYFAADLYSALDYLCYVSYCHFKNDGKPTNSAEARNVKFPYKNLKKSDVDGQEVSCKKQRENFAWDHFITIYLYFQPGQFVLVDASTTERYDRFKRYVLNCQVITKIGADGQPLQQQDQMEEAATNFNTLHYLRNTTVHRNLVDINVHNGWLYLNLLDGSHEFVPERIPDRDNDPDQWQSIEGSRWVTVPFTSTPERLLTVTPNLLRFVINTRDELLEIAYGPDGDIARFDDDEVRRGLDDGVHIGRQSNQRDYRWGVFEEKCDVMRTSDLWAV